MVISKQTHDSMTRVELLSLIDACERCECTHACYCQSNIEWAERKLAELDRGSVVPASERVFK